jgi:hypothetical protein
MKYVLRLIVLPFIAGIALVTAVKLFYLFCHDFLLYGGEMVTYRKDHTPKTIGDIMNLLADKLNSEQGVKECDTTDAKSRLIS